MEISSCKINHWKNPLGVGMRTMTFSWIVSDGIAEEQRILIKKEDILFYDTGWKKLNSRGTTLPLYLEARTKYTWTVEARNKEGDVAESSIQAFETGKMEESWEGKWITCKNTERHPRFRKEFVLLSGKTIQKARLYICGLGLYEAYLNDEKIGDAYLTPGCHAYEHYLQAQTYSLTSMHWKNGDGKKQVLEVLLGPGWYNGRFGFTNNIFDEKGYRLIAELWITYEDGTQQVISTDDTWKVTGSNIIFSNIYDGEIRDDTLEKESWTTVQLYEGKMPPVQDNVSVPIRAHEQFQPEILHSPSGSLILDIHQNMAGIFLLRIKEIKGAKVRLQFGEVLQDGEFYRDNLRSAKAEYVYISDGREHVLRPHFTYYGYRYVKVEGISDFEPEDFTAIALYSDVEMDSRLRTGNAKINQLISNTLWGMKSNFLDVPTDCPQRDERLGWTGDTQAFSETAFYLAQPYAFYRKYLYDCEMEQNARDGAVPDVVPAFGMNSVSAVWGDVTCILPWNMYVATGDASILAEHYESMKQWVEYIRKTDGENHGWRSRQHYGDWLALDGVPLGNLHGGTDEGFIADVYYRKSALIVSKTAGILGKNEEAEEYEALAQKILDEICREYYSPNGRCCINTQTAALLTITEKLNDMECAKQALAKSLEVRYDRLCTGFVGTPLLCETLADNGMEDRAYRLLMNEEYPGWLYAVKLGATTIWERWNSLDETGRISSTGMNSLNHYTYGSVVSWIWKGAAGIRPCEECPGYQKAIIRPIPNWQLKELEANLPTPSGRYDIKWKIESDNQIHLWLTIPEGCEGEVELFEADMELLKQEQPDNLLLQQTEEGKCIISGGCYEVVYHTKRPLIRYASLNTSLGELMRAPQIAKLLYQEVDDLEYLLSYTAQYSLNETLHNLNYDEDFLKRLNEKIMSIPL